MKLLGSTENKITKDQNGENVPHLEITQVVFIVILLILIMSKIHEYYIRLFQINRVGNLLKIYPTNHIFLKTSNSEYVEIEVWFTDQNSQPLEIEDRINLTLVIK